MRPCPASDRAGRQGSASRPDGSDGAFKPAGLGDRGPTRARTKPRVPELGAIGPRGDGRRRVGEASLPVGDKISRYGSSIAVSVAVGAARAGLTLERHRAFRYGTDLGESSGLEEPARNPVMSFCTVVPSTATVGAARARRAGPLLTATAASRPGTSTSLGLSTSGALLGSGIGGSAVGATARRSAVQRSSSASSMKSIDCTAAPRGRQPASCAIRDRTGGAVGVSVPLFLSGSLGRARWPSPDRPSHSRRTPPPRCSVAEVDDDEGGLRRSHPHQLGGRRSGSYPEVHELEGEGEEVVASEGGRAQVRHLLWPVGTGPTTPGAEPPGRRPERRATWSLTSASAPRASAVSPPAPSRGGPSSPRGGRSRSLAVSAARVAACSDHPAPWASPRARSHREGSVHGGPDMAPNPPALGASRQSRDAPRSSRPLTAP